MKATTDLVFSKLSIVHLSSAMNACMVKISHSHLARKRDPSPAYTYARTDNYTWKFLRRSFRGWYEYVHMEMDWHWRHKLSIKILSYFSVAAYYHLKEKISFIDATPAFCFNWKIKENCSNCSWEKEIYCQKTGLSTQTTPSNQKSPQAFRG